MNLLPVIVLVCCIIEIVRLWWIRFIQMSVIRKESDLIIVIFVGLGLGMVVVKFIICQWEYGVLSIVLSCRSGFNWPITIIECLSPS